MGVLTAVGDGKVPQRLDKVSIRRSVETGLHRDVSSAYRTISHDKEAYRADEDPTVAT